MLGGAERNGRLTHPNTHSLCMTKPSYLATTATVPKEIEATYLKVITLDLDLGDDQGR